MIKREEIIGDCRLLLGDCREILPTLGKVDAVVSDPPYGVSHSSGWASTWQNTNIANDDDVSTRDAFLEACGKPALVFGSWKKPKPKGTHTVLIWDKGDAAGMGDLSVPWKPNHEEIYVIGKGFCGARGPGILRHTNITWESHGRQHPHSKPVSLMCDLIQKCPQDWIILDPFAGSGTTGVACVREGRSFIGIEIDEGYFEIACKRIRDEYARPRLALEPAPQPVQEPLL